MNSRKSLKPSASRSKSRNSKENRSNKKYVQESSEESSIDANPVTRHDPVQRRSISKKKREM
jgi:hypothetical protein